MDLTCSSTHPTDDWSAWDLGKFGGHCEVLLVIPVQVLWCARAYRLVGGEDHRHEGLVLGPKRYLDGWCGARTQCFPAENCIVRRWSMLFTWPGCVWLYRSRNLGLIFSISTSVWLDWTQLYVHQRVLSYHQRMWVEGAGSGACEI